MFQNFRRKKRIARLCLEHARRHGMEREYRKALAFLGSPTEALEEWDLFDSEIQMKIKAEYNQLIDIELPPPRRQLLHSSYRRGGPYVADFRTRRRAAKAA